MRTGDVASMATSPGLARNAAAHTSASTLLSLRGAERVLKGIAASVREERPTVTVDARPALPHGSAPPRGAPPRRPRCPCPLPPIPRSPSSPKRSASSATPSSTSPASASRPASPPWTRRPPSILRSSPGLFELGLMGIEIPDDLRRIRRQLLQRHPRGRGARRRRPQRQRPRRRAEHAGRQRPPPLGHRRAEGALSAPPRQHVGRLLRPQRGRVRLRRLRPRLPGPARRRPLGARRPQALDHQRGGSLALPGLRQRRQEQGLQGHHRLPRRARLPRLHASASASTSSASAPPAPASWSSRAAASPPPACSARWARATRSPSRPSTRAASASAPR